MAPGAPARKVIGGASVGGLYSDHLSWGPNFLIAANGANLRRAGGDTHTRRGLDPTTHRVAYARWAPLEAPAYLLKRRDQTFLHVYHSDRPVPQPAGAASAVDGGGGDGGPRPEITEEQKSRLEALRAALLKEMHRVIDTFRKMDANGDGKVSMAEFRAVLPLLAPRGASPSPGDAAAAAGAAAAGAAAEAPTAAPGEGTAGAGAAATFGAEDTDALFSVIDGDGSGTIDYTELNAVLRQGLSITLSKRMQVGGAGEIALESKNKISLRGSHPGNDDDSDAGDAAAGGGAAAEGGPDGAGNEAAGAQTTQDMHPPKSASSTPAVKVASNSAANARQRAVAATAAAAAAREAGSRSSAQLLVSPPVVGPASRRSGQVVYSRHGEEKKGTTWFAVGGKNDFIMQPVRVEEAVRTSQSQSKLWQSVQLVRQHTGTVSERMHRSGMRHEAMWRQKRSASTTSLLAPPEDPRDGRPYRGTSHRAGLPMAPAGSLPRMLSAEGSVGGTPGYPRESLPSSASAPQLPKAGSRPRQDATRGSTPGGQPWSEHGMPQSSAFSLFGSDRSSTAMLGAGAGSGAGSGGFGGQGGIPLKQMYRGYDHEEYAAAPWAPALQTSSVARVADRHRPKESLAAKHAPPHVDVSVAATSSALIGSEYSRDIASLTSNSHALSRSGSRPGTRPNSRA